MDHHFRQWNTIVVNGVNGTIVANGSPLSPMDRHCRQWIVIVAITFFAILAVTSPFDGANGDGVHHWRQWREFQFVMTLVYLFFIDMLRFQQRVLRF